MSPIRKIYPKTERLKSEKAISALFSSGQSVSVFPLRLVYRKSEEEHPEIKFGVSVSKRYFRNAVDRNYVKRLLREAYRHQKALIRDATAYDFMLIFQSRSTIPYRELEQKTADLFRKFRSKTLDAQVSSPAPSKP